ncbi:FxsA family protein [Paenibacillus sp. J5C_2022]|uniref:FxsA family protein n=1 Tax=Paenibacillus sp. J5C2022 TaxID=2977129 RepID=UPI0021D3BA3A|nr:FxsA family protein [Paenibacillus sp. J5C2022]MCU6712442.1 FxsA family protein [Paenibacillus sp. J5C2022]
MYKWIFAALLVVPVIELWGILQVGDWLGGWTTFFIVVAMSAAGAYFLRLEGRKVWLEAQRQLAQGQMPGRSIIDGICVLIGGLLLLTPGFFTDFIGIVLLLPVTRPILRGIILQWLERKLRDGSFTIRRF